MDLKKQVIKSTKWNSLATVFNLGFQFLKLIVLTRLLDKSDFGLVAIATMVISFTSIFSDLGFTVAIIHKQDTTEKQYSSLYWANVLFSVFLFLLVVGLSPLVASFYRENQLTIIIPLLAIEILANAFGKMFQTLKMKSLDFKFISIVSVSCTIAGFIVTIILALIGLGVYSLVIGQLVQVLAVQSVYMISGRKSVKISLHFNIHEIKEYIIIGSYGLGAKVVDFAASKIDVFLIGRFFGMEALGVYNLAKELISKPYSILGKIFLNIGISAFAIIQNNINAIKEKLNLVLNSISLITAPLYVLVAVFADLIVPIIYSNSFGEIIPLVRILAVFGFMSSLELASFSVRDAKGKTNYSLLWTSSLFIITVLTTYLFKDTSVFVLAFAISAVSVIAIVPFWYINIYKIIGVWFFDFLRPIIKNALLAIVLGIVVYFLYSWNHSIYMVIALTVSYFALYLLGEIVMNKQTLMKVKDILFKKGNN